MEYYRVRSYTSGKGVYESISKFGCMLGVCLLVSEGIPNQVEKSRSPTKRNNTYIYDS